MNIFKKLFSFLTVRPPARESSPCFSRAHNHRVIGGGSGDEESLSTRYHQLREDYHIRGQILEVSHEILMGGSTAATLEDSFKHVIQICQEAIACDTSVIELYDESLHALIGVATDDGPYKPEGYFKLPIEESSLSGLAFKAGHTVAIDDVKSDPRVSQRIRRQFDAQSGIAAPLIIENKVMGVLLTMTRERQVHFTSRDISLMEGLANEAALAVQAQLLHKDRIKAEHRFQRLVELAPSAILLLSADLHIIEVNKKTQELLGYEQASLVGKSFRQLVVDQQGVGEKLFDRLGVSAINHELELRHSEGNTVPTEINAAVLSVAGQNVIQVFITDITKRKFAETELRREKDKAQTTLSSINDAVLTVFADGRLDTLNPSAEKMLGMKSVKAKGKYLGDVLTLINENTRKPISNPVTTCVQSGRIVELTDGVLLVSHKGVETQVEINVAPLHGAEAGVVMVVHDIGPARKLAQEMSYMATHDMLTGLINRSKFEQELEKAIASAKKGRNHVFCYIDLDRFKVVNDTCGHVAGDELLKQLAAIFQQSVRESDVMARLGGDEFGLLIEGCDINNGLPIAEAICGKVKEYHFNWGQKRFEVGASIGLIEIGPTSGDLTQVLAHVDSACYAAKDRGRNRVQVYRPDDSQLQQRKGDMQWTQRIQAALSEDRFVLYSQNIMALQDEHGIPFAEVLIKMRDEDGEVIPPNAFIPSAERYHLMPQVDQWVISRTFEYIESVSEDRVWFINLSGQSIGDERTLNCILECADKHGIDASRICFELNETAAIANLSRLITFVNTLRGLEFRFALDDFGSGLSSFVYLKNLSVDYIKIHGCFVKTVHMDMENRVMVEAIAKVAHSMNLKTIAECAETPEALSELRSLGVDYAQGFGISKPKIIEL